MIKWIRTSRLSIKISLSPQIPLLFDPSTMDELEPLVLRFCEAAVRY